uniref:WG repeat-containing protein n=1 Tax=Roseivirga sp. TaxID=1964215 RepID=UPI004047B669
ILSATYDEVIALDPNLLRLQKRNAALADSTGNYVLKFIYDGIGSNINGYVSTLDKGKVGLINTQKGINIPPDYDKQIEAYSDTILIATQGEGKGFINTSNQILSAFDYDEIQFFTEEVALARIENEWFLHRIKDESLLVEGILDFRLLNDTSTEKKLLITKESGKGIYSSVLKEVVPPTYSDIIVLGQPENPIYFAVKLVAEANIYVVIYYDKFGNKLFTQTFKQEEFFKIACPSN